MFDIQNALKNLPHNPGVYIMKNSEGEIIYIGKAISLKNRVRQYFQNSKNQHPKVKAMVSHIAWFEYILTDSELEALILECNLIKKHKPRYNILLKDDKHYPYIKVTVKEDYPKVLMVRKMIKDGSKYFGPYTDAFAVKETLEVIQKLYPIRVCNKKIEFGKAVDRPCLNYHINKCIAPCQGNISKEEYKKIIDEILVFLSGKHEVLIESLKEKMLEASEKLDFERAADLRDKIMSVEKLKEKQKIISAALEDQDVISFSKEDDDTCIHVFMIRGGKLLGRENFFFKDNGDTEGEMLSQFIMQFYIENENIPKEIILQSEIDEINIIENYLSNKRGSRVYLKVPKRGEKSKLLEMAEKNAHAAIEQMKIKTNREKEMTEGAVKELEAILGLEDKINRIEAFDISNIQGTDPVASMIVFENGKPKNKDYRRFKIKTVEGPNDYASMEEVLTRRFERGIAEQKELKEKNKSENDGKFSLFPDIIMMDGGKGQVSIAEKVLSTLNINIPVCGMVKDDNHRTRGLIYEGSEIDVYKDSNTLKLIARIQDEAHRFAITYHRSLKRKSSIASTLDNITGIGPSRRTALLNHFDSTEAIKNASIQELTQIKGMNSNAAKAVYEYFSSNK